MSVCLRCRSLIILSLVKSVIKMDAKSAVSASSLRDPHDTFMNKIRL